MQEEPTMHEGRAQILEMLMSGRLTVEQADRLLAALDTAAPTASREPTHQGGERRRRDERANDAFASLTAEQLIVLRDHGVSRAFIEQLRAAGLANLSVHDLIELSDHGVDGD
ncbi:MAG: SHOCT-like domain-containing protein, partial [Ktedonobacterales bacterium]